MTYYRVKPEFDGTYLFYDVPDKRKRSGKRREERELIGGELFKKREYRIVIKADSRFADIFEEVKLNEGCVYYSFGCLFGLDMPWSRIEADEYVFERKRLQANFIHIYEHKNKRMLHFSEKVFLRFLSIEQLKECINYYSSK